MPKKLTKHVFPSFQIFQSSYLKDICDALHDLVPFVQFQKREKHPWRSVNFSKVAGHCTNGTKSRNASHIQTSVLEKQ